MKQTLNRLIIGVLVALLWLSVVNSVVAFNGEGEKTLSNDTKTVANEEKSADPKKDSKPDIVSSSGTEELLLLNEKVGKLSDTIQQQQKMLEQQQQMIEQLQNQLKGSILATSTPATSSLSTAKSILETLPATANKDNDREIAPIFGKNSTTKDIAGSKANNGAIQTGSEPEKKPESIELAGGKLKIGTLVYGDYAFYAKTGFGPQFLTQINPPGPGNDSYNSFDITRAYLNFFFSPTDAITIRVTPNIFRAVGTASATKLGKVSAINTNIDGDLSYRLKFAYVDFNKLFSGPLTGDKLTIGVQRNPFVDWNEVLYGYRFVNLTPWNYLGFSAVQTGISMHGPVKSGNKQYIDYDFGVYTNAKFSQAELSEKKQVMARASFYPFGTAPTYPGSPYSFKGLGLTGFIDYGFTNVAPDTDASKPLYRIAALAHYTNENFGIAGEFDYGRNAFTTGNLFSGSGPAEEFSVATTPTPFANFDALSKALLNNDRTKQEGFDLFGHVKIPKSPFEVFGLYQKFLPNTLVPKNPLDFQRIVAGVSYRYSKNLRFALDSQNLIYTHRQFTFPTIGLINFDPILASKNPNGIANAVPKNTNAIFLNVEFSF